MFLESFLAAFAANVGALMIEGVGSKTGQKFKKPPIEKSIAQCVKNGITALITRANDQSQENVAKLTDFAWDYFQNRQVARELSKMLRGGQPEIKELEYLLEEECDYQKDNLPGLDFEAGMEAFIAAFMETALYEPELNRVIQAGELIKQSGFQQSLLEEMRKLVASLGDEKRIQAETIEAQNVVSGIQVINSAAGADRETSREKAEERHYLKTLIEKCDYLELSAIDESCTVDDALRVSDVFISLQIKNRNQNATEAIEKSKKLVILGLPGCGKSTIVNYLCTQLSLRRIPERKNIDGVPIFKKDESPIPVRIILRHFAAWIPIETKTGSAGLVWDYIEYMLKEWGCHCYIKLRETLQNGGGIIFFDGLDEVREKDEDAKRSIITEAVRDFAKPLEKCRVIVTCREYAYKQTDDWRLPGKEFPVIELALFDLEQIEMFTRTWYRVVGPQKGWSENKQGEEARSLFEAIEAMPHLREIAQYPLLLTLMAQVHGRSGYLPKDRADLYEKAVNLLLEHWDNRIVRDVDGTRRRESGLILRLGIQRDTLRSVLARLAFSAHKRQETETDRSEGCADISKQALLEELKKELSGYDTANEVLEYIHERAGLLTAQDNRTYTFPHRTFQEYLAATYIMQQGEFDSLLAEKIQRDISWWREVFLLAAGYSKTIPRIISNILDTLIPDKPKNKKINSGQCELILLATETINNTNFINNVEKEKEKEKEKEVFQRRRFLTNYEKIYEWLVDSLGSDKSVSAKERAEFGRRLAQVGDLRKEATTLEHMEFCFVPAGPFFMGCDEGYDAEKPVHKNDHLDYCYWISRHPITNAQFEEFIKAGGYGERRYWEAAEEAGYWESGGFKDRRDGPSRSRPFDFGYPFNLANSPVVGVSWYETLAFTQWLSEQWREQGILGENWRICLPSEAEWEKAAKGGIEIPKAPVWMQARDKAWTSAKITDFSDNWDRKYPWGDTPDTKKANYRDTGIGGTSALGCFLSGASPYGCLDMAGNVWEWTHSLWGEDILKPSFKYPLSNISYREDSLYSENVLRILRGGAFSSDAGDLRCTLRYRDYPDVALDLIGFRCVCVCAPNEA